MINIRRETVKGKTERKKRTNYRVVSVRLRDLNYNPHLEIAQLLQVFEQGSNNKVVSEIFSQQWYIYKYSRGDKFGAAMLQQFKDKVLRTYPNMLMVERKKKNLSNIMNKEVIDLDD